MDDSAEKRRPVPGEGGELSRPTESVAFLTTHALKRRDSDKTKRGSDVSYS